MKKINRTLYYLITLSIVLLSLAVLSACGSKTPTPTPTSTPTSSPTTKATIMIMSPTSGVIPQIGDVTVTVKVLDFNLVEKLGKPNVAGEGHIHYFVDVDAPTTPGQPAVTDAGTYAATTATSYTWHNIGGGPHKFSVELVNNDHTPLSPPIVASVSVNVLPEIGPASLVILSPKDGAVVPPGDIKVDIQVSNFNIVDKQGQANVSHEGHVHYYLDVEAPTAPGQPAIPSSGVWAHVAATTYTFGNVAAGTHTISVELINNDHTPLEPPVVAKININVQASTTPTPTPTPTPTGQSVTIDLVAQNMAFNKSTITVPAGASVTMNFDNKDSIPHNFALYTDSSATTSIFVGTIITSSKTTYTFTAPSTPGNYFFRCDVHPTSMTGTFIVE
jgi:plastocyanin